MVCLIAGIQPRGNQVRILDSRAAVYVQLLLISIADFLWEGEPWRYCVSQNTCLKLLPLPTRNGDMERWFYLCTILSNLSSAAVIQACPIYPVNVYWSIMTSLRKKPFFILQRSFFMYYSTTSANYHIITRNNVCRYLSQNTRIPDHIYGIATEAFQKKSHHPYYSISKITPQDRCQSLSWM